MEMRNFKASFAKDEVSIRLLVHFNLEMCGGKGRRGGLLCIFLGYAHFELCMSVADTTS